MAGVRRIVPEVGIEISDEDREKLTAGAEQLKQKIDDLSASSDYNVKNLLPDVVIFYNAVHYALEQNIFYEDDQVAIAEDLLKHGMERAEQLGSGNASWTGATGLVVRGYRSKLDDSVQPYGLIVPEGYDSSNEYRLDIWHHGRNAKLSELRFLHDRMTTAGEFTPDNTLVLHTYGRYCNAMKFAGEVDTLEAVAHAEIHYDIDEDRICMRGFSMGGAATWHLATHYADRWVAATPGAGFAETAIYQNLEEKGIETPEYEQKLWGWYDAVKYAGNLHQCPTIAYSGELDKQMQASDIMAEYMAKEGLELVHIIGKDMGHKFDEASKVEIESRLSKIVAKGRDHIPTQIRFTTYTLRYNEMNWVRVDGLEKHWERAQVHADIIDGHTVEISTKNVSRLTLETMEDLCPLNHEEQPQVIIDGQSLIAPEVDADGLWVAHFVKEDGRWVLTEQVEPEGLQKVHGLQGPIDDAFLEGFVMVTPTGSPVMRQEVTDWIANEQADAIYQWYMQFRGQPRVKADVEITDRELDQFNLILWGDPESNAVLKKIVNDLPIQWRENGITVGDRTFGADEHVPVLIFPNPLNPKRYVVINSGFTFASFGSGSNSQQTPKLPDWAVLDIAVPVDERLAKGVVACDFFDESWQLT